ERLFKSTYKLTFILFKNKKEGILTFSDYKKGSRRVGYYITYVCLFAGLLLVLMPFVWLFVTSFKEANEILQSPQDYHFFPNSWNFSKYLNVIQKTEIMKNVGNS